MARIVKSPEDRKLETILTAERLFKERGFKETSVDAMVREMGVAIIVREKEFFFSKQLKVQTA